MDKCLVPVYFNGKKIGEMILDSKLENFEPVETRRALICLKPVMCFTVKDNSPRIDLVERR